MQHTKHLWRAGILLLFFPVGYVIFRYYTVPPTFGEAGFYRYSNLAEQMAKEPRHGSPGSCAPCHSDKQEEFDKGKHASVNCQVCHAPLITHVKDGAKIGDMHKPEIPDMCMKCHQMLRARPKGFPQVDVEEHLEGMGMELEPGVCTNCHNAHSPSMEQEEAQP